MDEIKIICQKFFPGKKVQQTQHISGGHINATFKVTFANGESYILQAVNNNVFKDPFAVMSNIQSIVDHLIEKKYPLKILKPISSQNGFLEKDKSGNYWRAFPFIENTLVFEKVTSPKLAFEAALAFGLFAKHLVEINLKSIVETIPHFHDLPYRLDLFDKVFEEDATNRKKNSEEEIAAILKWRDQLKFDFEKMPLRVVHNDTKISNVLLDKEELKGVCVIDLDTVMPGFLVTDFGDMIRTMCCTASEEENNLDKVEIDVEIYRATATGFLDATKTILTPQEKDNLINGGIYIIFEQALRFLSDYLQGDIYYQVQKEDQNLLRARNQIKLLQSLLNKKNDLNINSLF